MKKLLTLALLLVFSLSVCAQREVTKFLGIPVDGTKAAMIQKLKAKGFTSSAYDRDILEGEFNGTEVNVWVVTNNNKVYRILVCDKATRSESDIKIWFNTLCRQFENNPKYIPLQSYSIPDDEKISYEILVNKKRYEAVFSQKATGDTEDNVYDGASMRHVWFMINEYGYDKYGIAIFYDNEYNHANGEDL